MTNRVEERVARGAARLDEVRPGWHRNVNVQTLDISSGRNCALGQVFGSYGVGTVAAGVTIDSAQHGFLSSVDATYGELTAEWKRLIETRLEAEVDKWAAAEPVKQWSFRRQPVAV